MLTHRFWNRGDIDDALGKFSLTLVDTLDSLVVMGFEEEFLHGVQRVIVRHVTPRRVPRQMIYLFVQCNAINQGSFFRI